MANYGYPRFVVVKLGTHADIAKVINVNEADGMCVAIFHDGRPQTIPLRDIYPTLRHFKDAGLEECHLRVPANVPGESQSLWRAMHDEAKEFWQKEAETGGMISCDGDVKEWPANPNPNAGSDALQAYLVFGESIQGNSQTAPYTQTDPPPEDLLFPEGFPVHRFQSLNAGNAINAIPVIKVVSHPSSVQGAAPVVATSSSVKGVSPSTSTRENDQLEEVAEKQSQPKKKASTSSQSKTGLRTPPRTRREIILSDSDGDDDPPPPIHRKEATHLKVKDVPRGTTRKGQQKKTRPTTPTKSDGSASEFDLMDLDDDSPPSNVRHPKVSSSGGRRSRGNTPASSQGSSTGNGSSSGGRRSRGNTPASSQGPVRGRGRPPGILGAGLHRMQCKEPRNPFLRAVVPKTILPYPRTPQGNKYVVPRGSTPIQPRTISPASRRLGTWTPLGRHKYNPPEIIPARTEAQCLRRYEGAPGSSRWFGSPTPAICVPSTVYTPTKEYDVRDSIEHTPLKDDDLPDMITRYFQEVSMKPAEFPLSHLAATRLNYRSSSSTTWSIEMMCPNMDFRPYLRSMEDDEEIGSEAGRGIHFNLKDLELSKQLVGALTILHQFRTPIKQQLLKLQIAFPEERAVTLQGLLLQLGMSKLCENVSFRVRIISNFTPSYLEQLKIQGHPELKNPKIIQYAYYGLFGEDVPPIEAHHGVNPKHSKNPRSLAFKALTDGHSAEEVAAKCYYQCPEMMYDKKFLVQLNQKFNADDLPCRKLSEFRYPYSEGFKHFPHLKRCVFELGLVLLMEGHTGLGKTEWIKAVMKTLMKTLFINSLEDLKNFRKDYHQCIIFDEFVPNLALVTLENLLAFLDFGSPRTIRILYQVINIPAGVYRIICSRSDLASIYKVYKAKRKQNATILRRIVSMPIVEPTFGPREDGFDPKMSTSSFLYNGQIIEYDLGFVQDFKGKLMDLHVPSFYKGELTEEESADWERAEHNTTIYMYLREKRRNESAGPPP